MRRFALFLVLIVMTTAAYAADPAIGVAEFRNDTSAGWWYGGAGRELAGMLSNELSNTGKFRVVEREKLDKVLEEQDLAEAGRVNKATRAKVGKVTGAKYLIFGTVSAFEENTAGGGGGISFRGINVGGKNIIKMTDLKACFESLGFKDVRTYIQSGNVLFRAAGSGRRSESNANRP